MPISEQTNTTEAAGNNPAHASTEPRKLRVVEIDRQGTVVSDTAAIEPGNRSILKVTCHGASMEIPTNNPVATACEIIAYLEGMA